VRDLSDHQTLFRVAANQWAGWSEVVFQCLMVARMRSSGVWWQWSLIINRQLTGSSTSNVMTQVTQWLQNLVDHVIDSGYISLIHFAFYMQKHKLTSFS